MIDQNTLLGNLSNCGSMVEYFLLAIILENNQESEEEKCGVSGNYDVFLYHIHLLAGID